MSTTRISTLIITDIGSLSCSSTDLTIAVDPSGSVGAAAISLKVSGVERVRITATGINGTNIGVTTPGTGAFTTLSTVLATGGQVRLVQSGNTTGIYERWQRNGVNQAFIGNGDQVIGGGNASDFAIDANSGNLILATAGAPRATFSSTGLAVTGALSATNGLNITESSNNLLLQGTDGIIYRSGGSGTNAGLHRFRYFDTDVAVISSTGLTVTGIVDINGVAASATAGHLQLGSSTQTTIGANGAASALTANPLGYLSAYLGTTHIIIPYYNA